MEEEVRLVKGRMRKGLFIVTLPFLIVVSMWLSVKIEPIPEFNDLKVIEGKLIKVTHTNGGRRGEPPYLILKNDDGLVSSVHVGGDGKVFKPYEGHRIMVWSADLCSFFGYICVDSAFQVKYMNKYARHTNKFLLDYKIVRRHMEKAKYGVGVLDYLSGGIALVFFLVGVYFFYDAKRKVKIIQDKFYIERTE